MTTDHLAAIVVRVDCGIALVADSKRLIEEIRRLQEEKEDA